jgi:hypothetical protein
MELPFYVANKLCKYEDKPGGCRGCGSLHKPNLKYIVNRTTLKEATPRDVRTARQANDEPGMNWGEWGFSRKAANEYLPQVPR